ncbi:MAG: hypothetical protein ACJ8AI_07635 [Rhodopila sp.]|jgi:hypothetical protein
MQLSVNSNRNRSGAYRDGLHDTAPHPPLATSVAPAFPTAFTVTFPVEGLRDTDAWHRCAAFVVVTFETATC